MSQLLVHCMQKPKKGNEAIKCGGNYISKERTLL